jgi:SAM-dependent methyltransferase
MDKKYITHSREHFFDLAKDLIKKDSVVLDIGAADGYFAKYYGRNDFYLVDGNQNTVNKFISEFPNYTFVTLPTLPFEDDFFDIIHCSHVVEHLQPQEFYDTLKEMDRILKPGGYLVVSAPLMWERFYDDLSHIKPYNPEIYAKYLTNYDNNSPTRKQISSLYSITNLTYRYKEYHLYDEFYNEKNSLVINILKKVINLLYRFGLRKYKKTGYTIVLHKSNK